PLGDQPMADANILYLVPIYHQKRCCVPQVCLFRILVAKVCGADGGLPGLEHLCSYVIGVRGAFRYGQSRGTIVPRGVYNKALRRRRKNHAFIE
ncbi:MAG: hypothetical protein ABFQ95_07120, partial [Pseudomonadota bacterium]